MRPLIFNITEIYRAVTKNVNDNRTVIKTIVFNKRSHIHDEGTHCVIQVSLDITERVIGVCMFMGFSDYFIYMQKQQGVAVGPGERAVISLSPIYCNNVNMLARH